MGTWMSVHLATCWSITVDLENKHILICRSSISVRDNQRGLGESQSVRQAGSVRLRLCLIYRRTANYRF